MNTDNSFVDEVLENALGKTASEFSDKDIKDKITELQDIQKTIFDKLSKTLKSLRPDDLVVYSIRNVNYHLDLIDSSLLSLEHVIQKTNDVTKYK
jgi:hypothetical protein